MTKTFEEISSRLRYEPETGYLIWIGCPVNLVEGSRLYNSWKSRCLNKRAGHIYKKKTDRTSYRSVSFEGEQLKELGVFEKGKYSSRVEGIKTKEYELWGSLLKRCYSERDLIKYPTYRYCTVSDNFKNFQYFAEWCNEQVGFGNKSWCLDKDILIKGNKIYSEDTCCFVPEDINITFTRRSQSRGEYPIGVTFHKRQCKYHARLMVDNVKKHLGSFDCPDKAFDIYKIEKEKHIKSMANEYRDLLDPKVYEALLNYEVNIKD